MNQVPLRSTPKYPSLGTRTKLLYVLGYGGTRCGIISKTTKSQALAKVPSSYPDIGLRYIMPLSHPTFAFSLHTYLVGETAIKKAVFCEASPTLHSVATSFVEWLSGPSSAKFLMVFLTLRGPFHQAHHFMWWIGEEVAMPWTMS